MKVQFIKMQGTGNDYIYFDCFNVKIDNPSELAIKLSDRNFGIGGDGVILVCPSEIADGKMVMFNADGSEGLMCGNGVRCTAKLLYDNNHVPKDKESIKIETSSGIKTITPIFKEDGTTWFKVDMGKAIFNPEEIPLDISLLNKKQDKIINEQVDISGNKFKISCVSMGNPHCVIFKNNIYYMDINKYGSLFENNPLFPEGINVEFVELIDDKTLKMRVFERGSGETLACGTGACASAVAACERGLCNKGEDITVKLNGGKLIINYTDDTVFMTGDANTVFEGFIQI